MIFPVVCPLPVHLPVQAAQPSHNEGLVIPRDDEGRAARWCAEMLGHTELLYSGIVPVSCESELRTLAAETRTTRNGKKLASFCEEQIKNGENHFSLNYVLMQEGLYLTKSTVETNVRTYAVYSLHQIIKDEEGIYWDGIDFQLFKLSEHAIEFYRLQKDKDEEGKLYYV